MNSFKFLLDENTGRSLRDALSQQWPDMVVWAVGEPGVPSRGTPDPDILRWCDTQQFALVTYNRASMPMHLKDHLTAGCHILGIFVLRRKMSIGQIIEALGAIWLTADPGQYADQITYLKPPDW